MLHAKVAYAAYADKRLPRAMENALYWEPSAKRKKTGSMIQYVARKNTLLKELDRAKCELPSIGKGYSAMREAGLSPQTWDTLETWLNGLLWHGIHGRES